MTRIHMDTEAVRETARLLNWTAGELDNLPSKLKNLAGSISGAWQGGRSSHYANELRKVSNNLQQEVVNLQRLAMRVGNEVNEWDDADNNGARAFMQGPGLLFPGVGILIPLLPSTLIFNNPSMPNAFSGDDGGLWRGNNIIKDWEANLDYTIANKWTSDDGRWNTDTELGLEAKLGVLKGAYVEGERSGNWQVGRYDIGGAVGEYGISQGEAGMQFGVGEDGFIAGAYGEYDATTASGGVVLGGSLLGLTLSAGGSAGSAEGFIGYKEGTVGASVGASAVAGEVGLGLNIAGANIGVEAGASLGFELGVKLGMDTEIKAGPFKIGLSFGKAITD